MNIALLRLAATCLSLCLVLPVRAQEAPPPAEPKCPQDAVALPASEASWTARATLVSASAAPLGFAQADLKIGRAINAVLHHTPGITYVKTPFKPGGKASYGGMFRLVVADAGIYRISLGNPSWLDVIAGDTMIESVAHQRGPACSGIRKEVDFPLSSGIYVIQISASPDATTGLIVTRRP